MKLSETQKWALVQALENDGWTVTGRGGFDIRTLKVLARKGLVVLCGAKEAHQSWRLTDKGVEMAKQAKAERCN